MSLHGTTPEPSRSSPELSSHRTSHAHQPNAEAEALRAPTQQSSAETLREALSHVKASFSAPEWGHPKGLAGVVLPPTAIEKLPAAMVHDLHADIVRVVQGLEALASRDISALDTVGVLRHIVVSNSFLVPLFVIQHYPVSREPAAALIDRLERAVAAICAGGRSSLTEQLSVRDADELAAAAQSLCNELEDLDPETKDLSNVRIASVLEHFPTVFEILASRLANQSPHPLASIEQAWLNQRAEHRAVLDEAIQVITTQQPLPSVPPSIDENGHTAQNAAPPWRHVKPLIKRRRQPSLATLKSRHRNTPFSTE